ncbi:uncharacterized protein LOC121855251 isoform X1 [Homarus americanus]|nr:uncharacterized protein LOC121855251 isoform X1 [Homarus americanus]
MLMAAAPVPVISATNHRPHSRPVTITRPMTPLSDALPRPVPPLPSHATPPPALPVSLYVGVSVSSQLVDVRRFPSGGQGEELPVLRVTPHDLTYRGEGADHIVLRVIGKGQVVRLRKTAVGGVTSREDLILRATRDEDFLHNVARPILGPLLTDESRLAILDPETLTALKHTVEPRRQGYRQHKEINNHGVACICPDAASIFISRRDTSSSSYLSSSYLSSSSALLIPSSLPRPPSSVPSSPSSSPSSSNTASLDANSSRLSPAPSSTPPSLFLPSPLTTAFTTLSSSSPQRRPFMPSLSSSLPIATSLFTPPSSFELARPRQQVSIASLVPPTESQGINNNVNLREFLLPKKSTNVSGDTASRTSPGAGLLEENGNIGMSATRSNSLGEDGLLDAKPSFRESLPDRESNTRGSTSRKKTVGVERNLEATSSSINGFLDSNSEMSASTSTNLGLDGIILEKTPTSWRRTQGTDMSLEATLPGPIEAVEPKNVCIEIKPKQGFLDYSTPELPLCRYCVKQFLKRRVKDGHGRSSYCPLDLFSGEPERMRRAVNGLILSPQNNFKVFLDGEPMDDCRPFSYLRDVIIAALRFDFASGTAVIPQGPGSLSPRSPLGRILAFQTLDQLGVFRASRLYHSYVRRLGDSRAADATLQDLRCWTGDTQYCRAPRDLQQCTRCKQDDQHDAPLLHAATRKRKHHLLKNESRKTMNTESPMKTDKLVNVVAAGDHSDGSLRSTEELQVKSVSTDDDGGSEDEEDMSEEEVVRKLQEYLLSTTAKDLSLMILLSGPHTSAPPPSTGPNTSPFIIELEAGVWFKCQVTGVDLVAKPSSKIVKHERDYKRLRDVLVELRSRGEEPMCCEV